MFCSVVPCCGMNEGIFHITACWFGMNLTHMNWATCMAQVLVIK